MPNPGRLWSPQHTARRLRLLGAGFALVGVAFLVLGVAGNGNSLTVTLGALWIIMAACLFWGARQQRPRGQRGYDQALPAPAAEVVRLAGTGQRIRAIKLYRQLNPGLGLKEAKDVVDEL